MSAGQREDAFPPSSTMRGKLCRIAWAGMAAAFLTGCARLQGGADAVDVTILVRAEGVPAGERVIVAGSDPALGSWNPAATPLTRGADGLWRGTFALRKGRWVEFKITRGSWATEALDERGAIPPNHRIQVGATPRIELQISAWKDQRAAAPGVTGVLKFHPGIGGAGIEPRMVSVWLPPGYDREAARRYPVLYLHDGQNCFDPARSAFGMEWRLDEEATRLIDAGRMEPLIMVGIDCNGPVRFREYGDTEAGAAYRAYVIDVVKPMIDAAYRTLPEREHTAVMGSSMGGCVSFLLAWERPDVFSRAACLSPSFDRLVIERVRQHRGGRKPIRLYLDNGGVGLELKLQKGIDRMLTLLPKRGFRAGIHYEWYRDPLAEHNENAWASRVWRPLEFLFGTPAP